MLTRARAHRPEGHTQQPQHFPDAQLPRAQGAGSRPVVGPPPPSQGSWLSQLVPWSSQAAKGFNVVVGPVGIHRYRVQLVSARR